MAGLDLRRRDGMGTEVQARSETVKKASRFCNGTREKLQPCTRIVAYSVWYPRANLLMAAFEGEVLCSGSEQGMGGVFAAVDADASHGMQVAGRGQLGGRGVGSYTRARLSRRLKKAAPRPEASTAIRHGRIRPRERLPYRFRWAGKSRAARCGRRGLRRITWSTQRRPMAARNCSWTIRG